MAKKKKKVLPVKETQEEKPSTESKQPEPKKVQFKGVDQREGRIKE